MAQQKGIGRLIQIGLAKESTRGTAQSSATFWNPWMDLTLDEKKEFATDNQAYGLIEDSVNMTRTKAWAAGSLNGAVMDTTFAYDGEFNLTPTGYYGPITAQAVLRFQIKYSLSSIATLDELGGNSCGPATRAKLNTLL
jgi:hypothetical protein